ncbi:MAG: hypothetical protein IH986_03800 [Planctomycetes bacterium]|nr:hypothetical protein [Planctomycetota bacterium]
MHTVAAQSTAQRFVQRTKSCRHKLGRRPGRWVAEHGVDGELAPRVGLLVGEFEFRSNGPGRFCVRDRPLYEQVPDIFPSCRGV